MFFLQGMFFSWYVFICLDCFQNFLVFEVVRIGIMGLVEKVWFVLISQLRLGY